MHRARPTGPLYILLDHIGGTGDRLPVPGGSFGSSRVGVGPREALSVHIGERAGSTLLGPWPPLVQRSASEQLPHFLFGCCPAYDKTSKPLRKGIGGFRDCVFFLGCFFCFCFR